MSFSSAIKRRSTAWTSGRRIVRSRVMLESPQGGAVQSVCFECHIVPEVVFSEQTSTRHAAFDQWPARPATADWSLFTAGSLQRPSRYEKAGLMLGDKAPPRGRRPRPPLTRKPEHLHAEPV